jgi:hypothetical protein
MFFTLNRSKLDRNKMLRHTLGSIGKGFVKKGEIVTIGNHSYVHLDLAGESRDNVPEILNAIDGFEKGHRELEVTGWHIDKQQAAYVVALDKVFGVWIDHKPKA